MVKATDSSIQLAPTKEWMGVPSYNDDYRAPGVVYRKEAPPNRGGGAGGGAFGGLGPTYERTRATHWVTNARAEFADRTAQRSASQAVPRLSQTSSSVVLGQEALTYQTHSAAVFDRPSERRDHPYNSVARRPVQQIPPYDLINGGDARPRRLKEGYDPALHASRKTVRLEPVEAKAGHASYGMRYQSVDGRLVKQPPPPLPPRGFHDRPPLNSLGALRPPL